MNLTNLRYFLEVVEAGTISQASRNLFISQQALSEQIRRLERHFRTPLLERTNPVRLTPAGQLVYDTARDVTARLELLDRRVARLASAAADRLVISTGMSATPPFLPELMAKLQEQMPGLQQMLIHPASLSGELNEPPPEADLLVGNMPFSQRCNTVELLIDPICVTLSEELLHRHFGPDLTPVQEMLASCTTLAHWERLPLWQDFFLPPKDPLSQKPGNTVHTTSPELIRHLCQTGQYVAVLPLHFARSMFRDMPRMRIYPLTGETAHFGLGIALRKGEPRSRAAEEFIRLAVQYFSAPPSR